jgi:PAS domain S-box-containing protein
MKAPGGWPHTAGRRRSERCSKGADDSRNSGIAVTAVALAALIGTACWLVLDADGTGRDPAIILSMLILTVAISLRIVQHGLRDSETRYRTVFENTGTAMCIIADDGTILMVNEEFLRRTGRTRREVEGRCSFTELVAPEDVDRVTAFHRERRMLGGSAPRSYELACLDAAGDRMHCLITVELVPGTSTSIASLIDISERKQAEEEMKLSNARLALINSMSQQINAGRPPRDAVLQSCDGLKDLLGCHYAELFLPGLTDEERQTSRVGADALASDEERGDGLDGLLIARSPAAIVTGGTKPREYRGREQLLSMISELAALPGREAELLAPRILDALKVDYVCLVPLPGGGEVVGQLAIGKKGEEPLSAPQRHFLEQYAEQLGLLVAKSLTEQALRDSESRYRLLFNRGNDAMFVYQLPASDGDGSFVAVNDVACAMLSYSRAELLQMTPAGIEISETSEGAFDPVATLSAEGEAIYNTLYVSRTGARIPVEVSSHLFEMDEQPTVLSITRDVTDRVRWQERLRRVNECFLGFTAEPIENIRRLIELCGEVLHADWAVYVRMDGGQLSGVACWQTPEGFGPPLDPTGLICERVMQSDMADVFHLSELEQSEFAATDPNVRDFGAVSYLGKAVHCAAGTASCVCTFYRDRYEPTEEDRRLVGIIAAAIRVEEERMQVRDQHDLALADLKTLNRDLEQARREAEEANSLKSEFLANTSHEIRTPLNGIIGYLQLVLNGLCDDREEEREFIAGAHESAERLLALIDDVLDVARIEAGKLRVDPEEVEVAALLSEVYGAVRLQAEQKQLALTANAVSDDLVAWCDEERLRQVLLNLLGNALKFTDAGGAIAVDVSPCHEEGLIRFEIVDTGIGIEPEKLGTIFEKFVQADGSTTRQRGGSGLGLTISQRLVEMMGGTISAHSGGEGRGATFSFTIPLHRPEGGHSLLAGEAGEGRAVGECGMKGVA